MKRNIAEIDNNDNFTIIKILDNVIFRLNIDERIIKPFGMKKMQCIIKMFKESKIKLTFHEMINDIIEYNRQTITDSFYSMSNFMQDEEEIIDKTIELLSEYYEKNYPYKKNLCVMSGCFNYANYYYEIFDEPLYCYNHKAFNMINKQIFLLKSIFKEQIVKDSIDKIFINNLFDRNIKKINKTICILKLNKTFCLNIINQLIHEEEENYELIEFMFEDNMDEYEYHKKNYNNVEILKKTEEALNNIKNDFI